MTLDLRDHLAALAERGASADDAPTSQMLARVHRRRAARTTATAAVGVAAAGAIALVAANGWPSTSSPAPAATVAPPEPTADPVAPQPTAVTSDDEATVPDAAPTVGVWDLFPDSTLDPAATELSNVDEALAAVTVVTDMGWAVYVLDADGLWTQGRWWGPEFGYLQTADLTPDGSAVVMTTVDGSTTEIHELDLATGGVSEPGPLWVDGVRYRVSGADVSPDGTTLAVIGTTEHKGGPVVVGAVDLPVQDWFGDGSGIEIRTLARFPDMSLDDSAGIAYSPDGSLLAVGITDPKDGQPVTTILDSGGSEVLRWPMAMTDQPWYGNDALRVTRPSPENGTPQGGYLQVSTATATTMTDAGESGTTYGPPPQPAGQTIGQFVTATGDPTGAFRIEDGATGTVRTWLTVVLPDGWTMPGQLMQRTR